MIAKGEGYGDWDEHGEWFVRRETNMLIYGLKKTADWHRTRHGLCVSVYTLFWGWGR